LHATDSGNRRRVYEDKPRLFSSTKTHERVKHLN
jgi:hypothetical protein